MKQILQNFSTGELTVEDVPVPIAPQGSVLVQNRCSVISAGTERATITMGQASLLDKAKKRPELVRQVIANLRKDGIFSTVRKVQTKLNTPKALGYSCAGICLSSRDFDGRFREGDRVACAGQDYASHAEVVAVPQNLTVLIPDAVSFEEAAFTTMGAIALQGVRQASPRIGERICVIGLGVLGLLSVQLARANGCSVFALDPLDTRCRLAGTLGAQSAISPSDTGIFEAMDEFTKGHGFDAVIITAASQSNDPIVMATKILRRKGTIVVVGDVRMDIPRNPDFYRKELELKIATSYGPGRYDPLYEEAGIDYPYGYVRFTENRNMEVFLDLLACGAVHVKPLISHTFPIEQALDAYAIVTGKTPQEHLGIVLAYPHEPPVTLTPRLILKGRSPSPLTIGFIGAGSFAQGHLLPALRDVPGVALDTVITAHGHTAKSVAEKFGFRQASTDTADIFGSKAVSTVFIATRHDLHADLVRQALEHNLHVFVEKPLALNTEELARIANLYTGTTVLMTGFNRRFAPVSRAIREALAVHPHPVVMTARINAGHIPNEHWIQDRAVGGGRIIGEMCHFVDLFSFIAGAYPVRVYASAMRTTNTTWREDDNLSVSIFFADGSIGSLLYTAMGDPALPKEHIEIFAGKKVFVIDDFKNAYLYQHSRRTRLPNSGKGHAEEVHAFLTAIQQGTPGPIPFESILHTTVATFMIEESLRTGKPQAIDVSAFT